MMKRMMYKLWRSVCDYVCVFICLSRKVNLIASGRGLRCVPRCSKRLLTSKHCDGCATNHVLIFDAGTKTNLCYCQAPRVANFLSGRSPIIELLDLSKLRDVEKKTIVLTLTLSDGGVWRSYTWQGVGGWISPGYTRVRFCTYDHNFSHPKTGWSKETVNFNSFSQGPTIFKKCINPMFLESLYFGIFRFQKCQVCGFLPVLI